MNPSFDEIGSVQSIMKSWRWWNRYGMLTIMLMPGVIWLIMFRFIPLALLNPLFSEYFLISVDKQYFF